MSDEDKSEEFVKFIRENREIIQRILDEDPDKPAEPSPELNTYFDRFQTEIEPVKQYSRDIANDFLRVLADEDVQKHFFTGCMELVSCFQAALRMLPMSEDNREIVDNAGKVKDTAVKNAAYAGIKSTAKSKLEKIDITSVKKKVADEFNFGSDRRVGIL